MASTKMYKFAQEHIPTKKLGKINPGRYLMIPPPPITPNVATDLVPPDDHSLDEWVSDWQTQMETLRSRLQRKVDEIAQNGREGQLGVTSDGKQRTPAVAVSYLTLQLIRETQSLTEFGTQLAKLISELQRKEGM